MKSQIRQAGIEFAESAYSKTPNNPFAAIKLVE